jgi:hypothetical protein
MYSLKIKSSFLLLVVEREVVEYAKFISTMVVDLCSLLKKVIFHEVKLEKVVV